MAARTGSSDLGFVTLLFVGALVLYVNSIDGAFTQDDRAAVTAAIEYTGGNELTGLSYRLNYALHGFNTMGYHGLNV